MKAYRTKDPGKEGNEMDSPVYQFLFVIFYLLLLPYYFVRELTTVLFPPKRGDGP